MPAPTIVFDLDGTLVDTAPDLVDTLNLILAREGLAPVPFKTARSMIGGGARTLIERRLRAAAAEQPKSAGSTMTSSHIMANISLTALSPFRGQLLRSKTLRRAAAGSRSAP